MAECELLAECLFFQDKLINMPAIADIMKKQYCLLGFSDCGRYLVAKALGRELVPDNLFPNNMKRAKIIISLHSNDDICVKSPSLKT